MGQLPFILSTRTILVGAPTEKHTSGPACLVYTCTGSHMSIGTTQDRAVLLTHINVLLTIVYQIVFHSIASLMIHDQILLITLV